MGKQRCITVGTDVTTLTYASTNGQWARPTCLY